MIKFKKKFTYSYYAYSAIIKEIHDVAAIQSDACNHGVVEKWPSSGNIWCFEAENGQIFSHFSHPCLG